MTKLKVAVIMGAESDLPVVKKAIEKLDELGVVREVRVLSAHRTPEEACAFAAGAKEAGFGVLICAAGKAAHLAGVMAGHTTLPVIGIPVKGSFLDGLDADILLVGLDTDAVPDPPLADDVPLEADPPEPDLWPDNPLPVPPAFPPPLPMLFPSWLFCIYLIYFNKTQSLFYYT